MTIKHTYFYHGRYSIYLYHGRCKYVSRQGDDLASGHILFSSLLQGIKHICLFKGRNQDAPRFTRTCAPFLPFTSSAVCTSMYEHSELYNTPPPRPPHPPHVASMLSANQHEGTFLPSHHPTHPQCLRND